jgi:histidinol phosphatase-like enzyme (inositol monophosphatase family)
MTIDLSERLELARHLAHEARKLILKHYSPAGVRFETKADGSPVTIADRAAEEFMRREIAKRCPQDAILGEEMGETPGAGGESGTGENIRWVLDPIDGTRAFTHGIPLFGCMVALEASSRGAGFQPAARTAIAGVVDFPALDESCYAHLGKGCWHVIGSNEPRRARVSSVSTLADAVVTMSTPRTPYQSIAIPDGAPDRDRAMHAAAQRLLGAARDVRGWGDCHAHVMVATGRMDAMINGKVGRWDVAPLEPILIEAGGRISDWRGKPAGEGGLGAVSTNGHVHDELMRLLTPQ